VIKAVGLDHIVLMVSDVERSLEWYRSKLGLDTMRVDEWRRGEAPFPSLRVDETTIIDLVAVERTGQNVDHVCFVVEPTDLDAVVHARDPEVVSGPVPRFGAGGVGQSIYVYDPDGNLVELKTYGDDGEA
jgi:catechol 2,3-dioxygenase-like lactoylglutathione lyase family enzyme